MDHVERALGHRFRDRSLLRTALTHPSFVHESGEGPHYERLEFLGDAVLDLFLSEALYRRRADLDQGGMTRLRARLVNTAALAARARDLGLGRSLRLGRGEERSGGTRKDSVLAAAFEAVAAAIFLDGGVRAARSFVRRHVLAGGEEGGPAEDAVDAKTALQEWLQARKRERPFYRLGSVAGPAHRRRYLVEAVVGGVALARGRGGSKKAAEQAAAAEALLVLKREEGARGRGTERPSSSRRRPG